MSDKPWGGLFKEESIEEVENYTSSEDIKLDERLVLYDIICLLYTSPSPRD